MSPDTGLSLLLAEEFDSHPPSPPPDLEALLATARKEARAQICAACEAKAAESRQVLAAACDALAAGLGEALSALDTALAATAHTLAGTIIAAIGTALPGWQAQLDRAATADIATLLLAALGETATLRLAVSRADAAELRALLPPDIALDADATIAPGALRLAWRNGRAVRDPAVIWNDIRNILTEALAPAPSTAKCNEPADSATE